MQDPLPLVAFETYMLNDDRDSHPMTFTIRLKFSGTCDREALQQAIPVALARHPLIAARIAKVGKRQLAWTWDHAADPPLDFADESVPLRFSDGELIDLEAGCGLRIWVRQGDDRVDMRVQFHHSCCDGVGAYGFVEDMLCAYHNASVSQSQQVTLRPLDESRLKHRTQFGLSWWKLLLRIPMEMWGLIVGYTMFIIQRPAKIYTESPTPGSDDGLTLLDLPAKTLTQEQIGRMKVVAKRDGASLNDLLLSDLCIAIKDWNTQHHSFSRWRPIRIMIPMSLRVDGDEEMPAANVVAMVFVDRNPYWLPNPRWLLKTIVWELNFIKALRLSLAFVRSVTIADHVPGGLRYLTRPTRCYATCVLSNMGRVFSNAPLDYEEGKLITGGMKLEAVESAPPIRPHTKIALSVVSYAGNMALILNYDRHAFTPQAAEEFFAVVMQQIEKVAQETSDGRSERLVSAV